MAKPVKRGRGRPRPEPKDMRDPLITSDQKAGVLRRMYDVRGTLCTALGQLDHVLDFLERRPRVSPKLPPDEVVDLD